MAGVKGRSGRRPMRDEERRLKIIDKAWDIAEQYLNDPSVSLKDKMATAEKIITKDMPQQLEHSGEMKFTRMPDVVIDGDKKEYDIGDKCINSSKDTTDSPCTVSHSQEP